VPAETIPLILAQPALPSCAPEPVFLGARSNEQNAIASNANCQCRVGNPEMASQCYEFARLVLGRLPFWESGHRACAFGTMP